MQEHIAITIVTRHSADCPHTGDEKYHRCDCWKHLRWRDGGKLHWEATKQRTLAGAQRVQAERQPEIQGGENPEANPHRKITLADTANLYTADKGQQGLKPNTVSNIKRTLNRLQEFFDSKAIARLAAIKSAELIAYRATWLWYESTESKKNEQVRIKGFFKWCVDNDLIAKNPASKFSTIKGERCPTMPFEPEEMKAIVDACSQCELSSQKALEVRALSLLMRWSGLSIIDAASLAKMELQHSRIGKEDVYRIVRRRIKTDILVNNQIPTAVAKILLSLETPNEKYFFWTGEGSPKSVAGHFTKYLKKVFEAAKIENGHPHRFRDTAAVELLKCGKDIRMVSKFLGHSSVQTTEKYYAPWNKAQQIIMDAAISSAIQTMEVHV